MQTKFIFGGADAPAGFAAVAHYVVRDDDGLFANNVTTNIDADYGWGANGIGVDTTLQADPQAVSANSDGFRGAQSFILASDPAASDPPNGSQDWTSAIASFDSQSSPPATDAEGPNGVAAAPANLFDTSDVASDSTTSSSVASIADDNTGWDGAIAAQVSPGDFDHQLAHISLAAMTPVNDGGNVAAAVWLAPITSAPAILPNMTPMLFGAPLAQAGLVNPGEGADGHQGAHAGQEAALLADSGAGLAGLDNPAAGFSGAVTSASVGPHGATAAQVQAALDESGLSVNGAGIKVGVLSDSFNELGGAAADEADGALPSAGVQVLQEDPYSGGTDEGRAMMQIIHDIAPGASLAFYTAEGGDQAFANGILALAAAGAKVIVDDAFYYDEPFFQNGVIAQAIQTVEAEGVTYVTAAGNDASNGYQAAWTPTSGSFDGTFLTDAESFGGSVVQTVTVNTEGTGDGVPLVLEWNQPYGAATSDLEVFVFHNGILYGEFSNRNAGQELNNPLVIVPLPGTGTYQIAIENLSGPNPSLIKEITEGDGFPVTIGGANAGTVVGHALTPGAITAGAVSAADTPAFGFSPTSESFSSSGAGAELLFANNGTALSSPDQLSPVVVSGVDDVSTTISGNLSDFYGTSASSASLAGVAALILSADPGLTPAQVEQIMEQTALPMSNSAVSGAGLVQVDAAVADAEGLVTRVIQTDTNSFGSTSLTARAGGYYLANSSGSGPELKYDGGPVVAGEFTAVAGGTWTLFGAAQTSTGYDVAWQDTSAGLYTVWATDSNGNYLSNVISPESGNSPSLEQIETVFNQDLNGDGVIGPNFTVIRTDGSTSLIQAAGSYYLENTGTGTGPELNYDGSPVVTGEFTAAAGGTWTLIGAVQTSTGYDVAWQDAADGLNTVWATDSHGNYLSNVVNPESGTSPSLEQIETVFNQDLNGDGTIGPTGTVIHTDTSSFGSTSLTQVANEYFLDSTGSSSESGPTLNYGGAPVVTAEFTAVAGGTWTLIGAVQTSTGYDVAWQDAADGLYTVWATDSHGNYLSNVVNPESGTSPSLEQIETVFNQDLNGDGTIGPTGTVIHTDTSSFGPTSLTQVANEYFLDSTGSSSESGPTLNYGGAPVVTGEFTAAGGGTWALIGAVHTASGYEVAWKVTGVDQYTVWNVDSNGNYLSNSIQPTSGTSLAIENAETGFNQDLNGDGVIGVPAVSGSVSAIALAAVANSDTFVFHWSAAASVTVNPGGADPMPFERVWSGAGSQQWAFSHDAPTAPAQAHFQIAQDGHDTAVDPGHHDSASAMNFHFTDPHVSHFIIS